MRHNLCQASYARLGGQNPQRRVRENPQHPSLHFKQLAGRGGRFSVRIGIHYRAVGWKPDASTVEWVWIGSHAEYDKIVG
jgi:hypothetical protein